MRTWREWWNGADEGSDLAVVRQENERLKLKLEVEELRSESLAMLLEEMRRWMTANVAVATRVGQMLGAVDESVTHGAKGGPPREALDELTLFGSPTAGQGSNAGFGRNGVGR